MFLTKPNIRAIHTTQQFSDAGMDQELFTKLRNLRKRLAEEAHVPPYIIFSDASLKEMATLFPQNDEQFAQIHGVGTQKLTKYSPLFTQLIKDHCLPLDKKPLSAWKSLS